MTGTSFRAPQPERAGAPLITEDELHVWGHRAIRQAAWGRELLGRLAARRGDPLDRAELRYAVTSGPDELALVWPTGNIVVYVAPGGSVLQVEADGLRGEHYEAFAHGERTPTERFGPPADGGGLSRSAIPGLADDLAARAGLQVVSRRASELLAVGDFELQWVIAEEDGALVSYRVERGVARELVRSADAAVAVRAVESSLGLAEHGER